MKFPFILRSDHDEIMRQNNLIIAMLQQIEVDLRLELDKKQQEILSLTELLTADKPLVAAQQKEKKPFKPSKMSYRGLAQSRSQATLKPPPDSASQLEERVKNEGGTV
jgi:hypothetical protein